ncbi:23242_t:CDS:2, partial [Cetraspora pellucida]
PTEVTLEVYEEACHCFQNLMLPEKITQLSIKHSCDFIKNCTLNESIPNKADPKVINTMAITPNCEVKELDEKFLECLKWENIGVVPELEVET